MVLVKSRYLGIHIVCTAFWLLGIFGLSMSSAHAAKRPVAVQSDTFQAPVKLPNGQIRQADITVFVVVPNVKFIEAACAYRKTVGGAARYYMTAKPMSLESWGKLERGSQDKVLSQYIRKSVQKNWIYRVHVVAGTRARPKYTVWYEQVRILKCSDWERWKRRDPPPPPPIFSEPIFQQFRGNKNKKKKK